MFKSQKSNILGHLLRVGHITNLEGIRYYGAMRTQARINDLRNDGWRIKTVMVKEQGLRPGRYARYELV